jgi:predicted O-methyltransferase YrrM
MITIANVQRPMSALDRVDSIPGWLRPEDADKLDELARSASGPILEIGTYHGKSAILMALALRDAKRDTLLYTLDVNRKAIEAAAGEAWHRGVADRIVFVRGALEAFRSAYPHVRPALTFIDGDHSREGVNRDLAVLESIVPAGGLLLFHDFADPRNDDPACGEIKVRPAVQASWVARQCDLIGTFGVCGLYVRRDAPRRDLERLVADIALLDKIGSQVRYRLGPAVLALLRRARSPCRRHDS